MRLEYGDRRACIRWSSSWVQALATRGSIMLLIITKGVPLAWNMERNCAAPPRRTDRPNGVRSWENSTGKDFFTLGWLVICLGSICSLLAKSCVVDGRSRELSGGLLGNSIAAVRRCKRQNPG